MTYKPLCVFAVVLAIVGRALCLSDDCAKKCESADKKSMCGIVANVSSTVDPETFPSKCAFDCAVAEAVQKSPDSPLGLLCNGACADCQSYSPFCKPDPNPAIEDCKDLRANQPVCTFNKVEYANVCALNCELHYQQWQYTSVASMTAPQYDLLKCYTSCATCSP